MENKYDSTLVFNLSSELKGKVLEYAKSEGVKAAVVIRKALVKYLKEKEVLDSNKNYL